MMLTSFGKASPRRPQLVLGWDRPHFVISKGVRTACVSLFYLSRHGEGQCTPVWRSKMIIMFADEGESAWVLSFTNALFNAKSSRTFH